MLDGLDYGSFHIIHVDTVASGCQRGYKNSIDNMNDGRTGLDVGNNYKGHIGCPLDLDCFIKYGQGESRLALQKSVHRDRPCLGHVCRGMRCTEDVVL